MKRVLYITVIAFLAISQMIDVRAAITTPSIIPYEGVLKDSGGAAITAAHNFRFSIWNDSDYDVPADFDGLGDIPGVAPGYSGYQEVQTITPDSNGFFQLSIGSVTPIPDFNTTDHLYLQVEIKPNGSPNTSYELLDVDGVVNANDRQRFGSVPYANNADFLDNAEVGTSVGNLVILGAGDVFPAAVIPGGTNVESFELDQDGTGGVIELSFGDSLLNRVISFDPDGVALGDGWFNFSDDVHIVGDTTLVGTLTAASGITITGGGTDFSAVTQFRIRESDFTPVPDCANVGEIIFDTVAVRVKYCTASGSPGTWSGIDSEAQDFEDVYSTDADKALAVSDAVGLTFNSGSAGNILFNLQSTGDLVIQDNGTNFALFSDVGLFELSGLENTERLRLTDTTNADSVGLYVGTGTPDAVISAERGSAYFDEAGALYINNSAAGTGTTWNRTALDKAQTVTVAKSGGQFTSVKAAVDSITDATSIKPYVVQVHPGVYVEAPITLPSFVSIVGFGTVSIVSASPTATLITAGTSTRVDTVVLSGASGAGGVCYRSTTTSLITNAQFASCETGILATGATASVSVLNVSAVSGAFTNFISAESGAILNAATVAVRTTSAVTRGLRVVGTGTAVEISTYVILTTTVVDGVFLDSGAMINLLNTTIQNTVNGIHVGSSGASILRGTGGIIENQSQYSLFVESAATRIYYDALQTEKEKFNIHPDALLSMVFNNTTLNEEGTNVFGRFSVGTPEHPDDTYLGQGDSYTQGMLVYTFDGVNYTDVTADASNHVGTPFGFPAVTTGNSIYLSSSRQSNGDAVKFTGFHYVTTSTAADFGTGDIVHEYWNGSAWTPFTSNCVHGSLSFTYDQQCFLRPSSSEHDNLELEIDESWVKNDPPGLGTDYYWIRLRISSDLLVSPVFESFKLHTDSVKFTSKGQIQFLGHSRYHRTIVSDLGIFFGLSSETPENASFTLGANGVIQDLQRASFRGSDLALDRLTGSLTIPLGIDTSSKLDPVIYWKKTDASAGNVQWKIDYAPIGVEHVHIADGSNIPTAPRATGESTATVAVQTIETTPDGTANTANQIIASPFPGMDISHFYEGDQIFLKLYRDAADADDTYTSRAVVVAFRINGTFWRLGADHEEF